MDDTYIVVRHIDVNDVDPDTGQVVGGVRFTVRDLTGGGTTDVFVPNRLLDGPNAQVLIEDRLGKLRAVRALGAGATPQGS